MTPEEREQMRQWVETWKRAGPELEKIRREEVRTADNSNAAQVLGRAIDHAIRSSPARTTSGMVEMQEWFRKLPR